VTKDGLIAKVHHALPPVHQRQEKTLEVVDQVLTALAQSLQAEAAQMIHQFGTCTRRYRPARRGRHPRTGVPLTSKAAYIVTEP
jgi:nucleoid DNA-binding protein